MKNISFFLSLVFILITSPLRAEEAAPAQEGAVLVKVSTIESAEAFLEFQHNVRMVQAQRERVLELAAQIERAGDNASLRASLQEEQERVLASLERNNQRMIETYGFTITRDYTVVVEKAHIYMLVTPEEARAINERQEAEGASD